MLLWNSKVHYRLKKHKLLRQVLNQLNPAQEFKVDFSHILLILPYHPYNVDFVVFRLKLLMNL
jgi:hypothetical protein